jgi:hypothetical protein
MPPGLPWQQGTTDRDVTTRLKFSQPERIRRLVGQLKAQGQEKGEDAFDKRFAVNQR